MATETVPHTTLEGQLEADLLSYEPEPEAVPVVEWQPHEIESAVARMSADTKTNPATALSPPQPTITGDGTSEIDWEDHAYAGNNGVEQVNAGIAASDGLTNPGLPETRLAETDVLAPVAVGLGVDEVDMSGDFIDMGNIGGAEEQPAVDDFMEHEITYDEDIVATDEVHKQDEVGNSSLEVAPETSHAHDKTEADAEAEAEAEREAERQGDAELYHQEFERLEDSASSEVAAEAEYEGTVHTDDQHDDGHVDQVVDLTDDDEHSEQSTTFDITVNYRNEEYPLIHGQNNIDTQMGFFDEPSVLDLTMDELLPKFREELAGDLGPQDELVLQVDELGLEYAESTHLDHLSGVTLRQLHGIFDQLVKNQDPDTPRTLYTNLITRPHPTKRLDMLADEAYNGKGLDEVVYRFRSSGEPLESQGGSADDAIHVDISDDEDDEDDAEHGGAASFDDQADSEHQDEDGSGGPARGSSVEYLGDSRSAQSEYADEADGGDGAYAGHGANDQSVDDQEAGDVMGDEFLAEELQVAEMEAELEEMTSQNDLADDDYGSAHNPQAIINDDDQIEGLDYVDLVEDAEAPAGLPETEQAESSASATLHGDGDGDNEIDYDENDIADGSNAEHPPAEAEGGRGPDEIDWRDFPEEDESSVKEPAGVSGKRPHAEVEKGEGLGLDDENDFKRRRSS